MVTGLSLMNRVFNESHRKVKSLSEKDKLKVVFVKLCIVCFAIIGSMSEIPTY
jgi:hypothetical protein